MKDNFVKFPSTPHLSTLPGVDIRADKVLSEYERDAFLQNNLIIEEKVDGANLGLSFDSEGNLRVQNRGTYLHLPRSGQWKKLDDWLRPRIDVLFEHLADQFILFGEWCYAQHTVFYDQLPDWFLAFDIYDKRVGRFLPSEPRNMLFKKMSLFQVPVLAQGHFTYPELPKLLSISKFSDQPAEGIYLRYEQEKWLEQRAKLVRPTFIQLIENHWSQSAIKANQLRLNTQ